MPRDYEPKGRPAEGRKPIDDRPFARGVQLAVLLDHLDRRRALQAAAQILQERHADGIGRDSATRRIREVLDGISSPITPQEQALLGRLLVNLQAAARWVRQAPDPRVAMRNVLALTIADAVLRLLPALQAEATQDPAVRLELTAWARQQADTWMERSIVTIPC